MRMLVRSAPRALEPAVDRRRLLVLHAGGPAPGMNTAVRAAVRVARDAGHLVLGARHGFEGVLADDLDELDWMSVSGWVSHGGAELGTSRRALRDADVPRIAERFEQRGIDGVLIVGGHTGYATAHRLSSAATEHRALRVPFVCLPATINNDLPATEVTIGADTAVNNIVEAVDKIKQSAVATRRCHVVEVMGNDSGYLAMAGGMATGAERVYIPEYGISMDELRDDVDRLKEAFRAGQRLGLVIRSQDAEELYTTPFLWAFFATEGENVFEVRQAVLGHLQQGGDPSPFDRIHATRLAARGMEHLLQAIGSSSPGDAGTGAMVGVNGGSVTFTPLVSYPELLEPDGGQRPIAPAWLPALAPVATTMALPTSSPAHDVSRQW